MLAPATFPPYGGASCQAGFIFTRWAVGLRLIDEDGQEHGWAPVDPSKNESNLAYPHCLPDGRVLGVIRSEDRDAIAVFDAERRAVLLELPSETVAWPVFATDGYILFERAEPNPGIGAVPVSDDVSSTTGPPVLILPGGRQPSVSDDGVLVAVAGTGRVDRHLVWVDREGHQLSEFGRP
ncbi:MAG: hypothetical protein E2P02_28385 [Acidobacteria bacterium]|nr:MAG: hypothetical protein E2P02_28385 [Acidobacteriota bacterium]